MNLKTKTFWVLSKSIWGFNAFGNKMIMDSQRFGMVSGNIITLQNQFTQHGEDPSLAGIERSLNSRWVETLVVAHNQKEEIKDVQQKAVEGVRAIKKELKIEDNIEKDLKETKRKDDDDGKDDGIATLNEADIRVFK